MAQTRLDRGQGVVEGAGRQAAVISDHAVVGEVSKAARAPRRSPASWTARAASKRVFRV